MFQSKTPPHWTTLLKDAVEKVTDSYFEVTETWDSPGLTPPSVSPHIHCTPIVQSEGFSSVAPLIAPQPSIPHSDSTCSLASAVAVT